jgi:hypothetical protein
MSVPHSLGQDEALTRIRNRIATIRAEYGERASDVQEQWTGNVGTFRATAMGFSVAGTVTVSPTDVSLSADLPFAAAFFKDKIEATIRDRAAELLG